MKFSRRDDRSLINRQAKPLTNLALRPKLPRKTTKDKTKKGDDAKASVETSEEDDELVRLLINETFKLPGLFLCFTGNVSVVTFSKTNQHKESSMEC